MVEAALLRIEPHPLLHVGVFETRFSRPLGELASADELLCLLSRSAAAPLASNEAVRQSIRDMLRHGGYKPTGRGKPASEYLVRAAEQGQLGSINVAVDACNAVSLHSGLPISIVDVERTVRPLEIAIVRADVRYPFNASGQLMRVEGLVCLIDAEGPCASGVKDSERTKTRADTTRTLSVVWGARALAAHTREAVRWYRALLERLGARTEPLESGS